MAFSKSLFTLQTDSGLCRSPDEQTNHDDNADAETEHVQPDEQNIQDDNADAETEHAQQEAQLATAVITSSILKQVIYLTVLCAF